MLFIASFIGIGLAVVLMILVPILKSDTLKSGCGNHTCGEQEHCKTQCQIKFKK